MKLISFFKYKKIIQNMFIYCLIFYLLAHSKLLVASVFESTNLFITKLIPALFPYLLITEFLINSGNIANLAFGLDNVLSKIFKIPKNTASCVVVGFLLGYPNSAKCILKLYENNKMDCKTAVKLVSFTSNANISYIIATIGLSIFKSIEIGIILAISHFLSAIIIGILFPSSYNNSIIQQTNANSNSFEKIYSPFELLYISVYNTLKTLGYIFAYTVIFSLIPNILLADLVIPETIRATIIGIFEISNGINNLSLLTIPLNHKLVLVSFVLSFSSLMIHMQIFSFVYRAKVKFSDLVKFKLIQGILSSIITFVIVGYVYKPLIQVFFNQDNFNSNILSCSTIYMLAIIVSFALSIILFRKKRQE